MKGKIKKIEVKEVVAKETKNKFTIVEFTCDVIINDKGELKTARGSWGADYAKKYLEYCGGLKLKELLNKDVDCTLSKRVYTNANGEERVATFIKYMNLLDDSGEKIVMPKEDLEF